MTIKIKNLLPSPIFRDEPYRCLTVNSCFIVLFIFRLSPIGVCFLVAAKILEIESFEEMVGQLGWYFMTVLIGLFVHGFGTIAVIFFLTTRSLPYKHVAAMGQVLATAFGTGSR